MSADFGLQACGARGQVGRDYLIVPWCVLTTILLCVGVPLHTSALIVTVVLIQCAAGLKVINWALPATQASTLMLIGPSFAIGVVLWVVPVQALGSGWLTNLAVFGMLTAFAVLKGPGRLGKFQLPNDSILSVVKVFATVTGLACVMTSGEWPSFVFAGMGFLALGLLLCESPIAKHGSLLNSLLIASSLAVLLWSSAQLKTFGWLITDDYSYLEALRVHLAEFGIWQSFGPTNISLYYWISPAWVGQISQVTLAADWLVVTRVSTLLFSLSLAATTICLVDGLPSREVRTSSRIVSVAALMYIFVSTGIDFSGTSTFAVFSICSSLIFITLRAAELLFPRRSWLLIALLVLATVFTKFMAAPVSASLVSVVVVGHKLANRRFRLMALVALIPVLCIAFVVFLEGTNNAISRGDDPLWKLASAEDLMVPRAMLELAPHAFSFLLPVLLTVLVWSVVGHETSRTFVFGSFLLTSLCFTFVSLLVIRPGHASDIVNYFAKPAMYFAVSVVAATTILFTRNHLFAAGIGVASSLVFVPQLGFSDRVLSRVGLFGETIESQHVVATQGLPVAFGILIAIIVSGYQQWSRKSTPGQSLRAIVVTALLVVVSIVSIQTAVGTAFRTFSVNTQKFGARDSGFVASVMGDPDLEDVGRWLRKNTDSSVVIATNDICEIRPGEMLYDTDYMCHRFANDHTLARTSHRRFLIVGPRFHYENRVLRDSYVRASLKFGETLADADRDTLLQLGAKYFILCQSCTRREASDSFPTGLTPSFVKGKYSVFAIER